MIHYKKMLLITKMNLPIEIERKIKMNYKYDILESTYKKQFNKTIDHLQYYIWLNKKLIKKDKNFTTILKTIKEFDYYSK